MAVQNSSRSPCACVSGARDRCACAEQGGQRRHDVLLCDWLVEHTLSHELIPMQEKRDIGVVRPWGSVHVRVERILVVDDEVAFVRDEEHLSAASGEIAAREHVQPLLLLRTN